MDRLRKVLLASAFHETCIVEVLRDAAAHAASPATVTALLAAAHILENDAEILLHAAHRIDLVLHHPAAVNGSISLIVMD
jgi:hypothetical protein